MKLKLTQGYYTDVDPSDYEALSAFKWHVEIRRHTNYAATSLTLNGQRTTMRLHSFLLGTFGRNRELVVDHIDGNGLNNTRRNLRLATVKENTKNSYGHDRRLRGVTRQKRLTERPWQARIHRNGVTVHLGYFPTAEEAATAYNNAASSSDLEFAKLNPVNAVLSDNFRRLVVNKSNRTLNSVGKAEMLYTLSCGHVKRTPWFKRAKIGSYSYCEECK